MPVNTFQNVPYNKIAYINIDEKVSAFGVNVNQKLIYFLFSPRFD